MSTSAARPEACTARNVPSGDDDRAHRAIICVWNCAPLPRNDATAEPAPLRPADTDALLAYEPRPEVCRWVPFEPMTAEVIAARMAGPWARTTLDGEGQSLTLGVTLTATQTLIGDVVLFLHSLEHRGGEIGYVMHPDHGGHGVRHRGGRGAAAPGL